MFSSASVLVSLTLARAIGIVRADRVTPVLAEPALAFSLAQALLLCERRERLVGLALVPALRALRTSQPGTGLSFTFALAFLAAVALAAALAAISPPGLAAALAAEAVLATEPTLPPGLAFSGAEAALLTVELALLQVVLALPLILFRVAVACICQVRVDLVFLTVIVLGILFVVDRVAVFVVVVVSLRFFPARVPLGGPVPGFFALTSSSSGLACLLYTSPSPRDATLSRMPSSA